MSDQTKTGNDDKTQGPFVPPLAQSLPVQMQALLQEQAEFLEETQRVMAAWMKRRQEAMEANLRTLQTVGGCTNPAALSSAYSAWLTNSMNRIFADMNETREEALRLAQIGQKSMTALFYQNAKAPPPKDPLTASGTKTPQTMRRSAPRKASRTSVRKAAE